jgi:hypothetical protein
MIICLSDFIVMPAYMARHELTIDQIMTITDKLRPEDKLNAIVQLSKKSEWTPLTTTGGGMFFIAFGSLLSVAAYGRFRVQEAAAMNGYNGLEEPNYPQLPQLSPIPTMQPGMYNPQQSAQSGMQQPTTQQSAQSGMQQPTTQQSAQSGMQQPPSSQQFPPPVASPLPEDPRKSQFNNPG